ncbi:hypothetical protein [Phenylobacterium sp.]
MARAPAQQPSRPFVHPCACGAWGCYGLGGAWFCRRCVPAGFLPHDRRPS